MLGAKGLQKNQSPLPLDLTFQLGSGLASYCTHLCPQFLDTSPSAHSIPDPGPGVEAETRRKHSPWPYLEN